MILLIPLEEVGENIGSKRFSSYWMFEKYAFFLNAEVVFSAFLFGGKKEKTTIEQ